MKEKLSKILILILTIVLIYKIVEISAAYKSRVQEDINSNVQPWVILVNNENIATVEVKSFDLTSITKETGYTKEGKIAPGTSFQIPIEIDATQMEAMDIRYDITIQGLDKLIPNIKIQDVLEETTGTKITKTGPSTYTGIINKQHIENSLKHKVLLNLIWENDEENNELDTQLGTSEETQKIQIPVSIIVAQYGNEEIKEYTEGNTQI